MHMAMCSRSSVSISCSIRVRLPSETILRMSAMVHLKESALLGSIPLSTCARFSRNWPTLFGADGVDRVHMGRAHGWNQASRYGHHGQERGGADESHGVPRFQTKEQCAGSTPGQKRQQS